MPDKEELKRESKARRGIAKAAITRLEKFHNELTPAHTMEDINIRLEALEKAFIDFKDEDFKVANFDEASELEAVETRYFTLKSKFREAAQSRNTIFHSLHQQFNASMVQFAEQQREYLNQLSDSFHIPNSSHSEVRLPQLQIPHFSGDYSEFPAFKDLFISSVHNKESLSDVQRFQYLKGLLKGEAASLIRHILVTDANYKGAWDKILARYDKKRCVITSLLNTFFSIQPVQTRSNLRQSLYNIADEVFRGLEALGTEANQRDPWLIHWMFERVDNETKQAWSKVASDKEFPTLDDFMKFLDKECDEIDMLKDSTQNSQGNKRHMVNHRVTQSNLVSTDTLPCSYCSESHHLSTCQSFKDLEVAVKRNFIQTNNMCYNCLSRNHHVTSCPSRFGCKQCKRRHHTLLHINPNEWSSTRLTEPGNSTQQNHTNSVKLNNAQVTDDTGSAHRFDEILQTHMAHNLKCSSTILPTALVHVKDVRGMFLCCRVLLDSGSQASFISEACIQRLGLPRSNAKYKVSGIATNNQYTKGLATIILKSRYGLENKVEVNVFIMNKLTTLLPSNFNINNYEYLKNIQLADPDCHKLNEIDIVIGSNKFFELLSNGQLKGKEGTPIAQNTVFGWIISGEYSNSNANNTLCNFNINIEEESVNVTLKRFFEMEDIGETAGLLTKDEEEAEEHYKQMVTRRMDGKYQVALPFKGSAPALGHSAFLAIQRLKSIERRMQRDPVYKKLYVEFMSEYLKLNHMEKIEEKRLMLNDYHCYLPHHAVLKASSTTTKLRTVFDGSVKTTSGASLNDTLLVGPTIQPSLWSILLRFRTHPIAICADVEKMYRQVMVRQEDLDFQRIVWRESPELPIQHFCLKTVTYGTSSAPFLAIRSLVQLAKDNEHLHPKISEIIRNDFYVDDLLSGAKNVAEAINLKDDLNKVLKSGGFPLRKWVSNSPILCDGGQDKSGNPIKLHDNSQTIKVLGLAWVPETDLFEFNVKLNDNIKYTKRALLSESSKIFDPLGWLAPSTVVVKILFQMLWLRKVDWDDELPADILSKWKQLRDEFNQFKSLKIKRHISWTGEPIQLHGFCDASESAYAAVIYTRIQNETGIIHVSLVASKTKVAPLRQITIPRLELCAAHLLTKLFKKVKEDLAKANVKEFAWTDSQIVLAWISDQPRRWKTFVANRTSQIIDTLPRSKWGYVKSAENPADSASRGIFPKQLKTLDLWWNGPKWLQEDESSWQRTTPILSNRNFLNEERMKHLHCSIILPSNDSLDSLFQRVSSWRKVLRIIAYCKRPARKLKGEIKFLNQSLTITELQSAEWTCIRWCQHQNFAEELGNLTETKELRGKGKLSSLAPFIDSEGILRVGGRIQNSTCSYNTKHPVILPNSHVLSKMIVTFYHQKYFHPGLSLLSSLIKQKFWIVNGRSMIRAIVHQCHICVRHRATTSSQLMGSLPTSRVTVSRAFSKVGIDYAGPISIASKKGRGATIVKAYISVFVCMATKAIHLETVSDLSSEAFLAALKRFIGRRGLPLEINCDNGTNFVGAANKINKFYKDIWKVNNNSIVSDYYTSNHISWKFIPPAAPHFGGLWEAGVKSMKTHLVKVTGNSNLTFEEMTTLTCQIEAILNSRPLCQMKSEDPTNNDVLTPGHFLIMAPLTSLPEPTFEEVSANRLTRWEHITKLVNTFWKRYSREYLHTLQQRNKWQHQKQNLQINDIVLIKEDNLPASVWPKARIVDIHPGSDGLVRVVTLRTQNASTMKRPIHKIVPLPIN